MLLSKSYAVKKPSSVVTSDQPFFDPGTSTSVNSSGVTVEGTGRSLALTTGEVAVLSIAASKSATQSVEASGAGTAIQPVEAPSAGLEVLLTSSGNAALYAEQTSTGGKTQYYQGV